MSEKESLPLKQAKNDDFGDLFNPEEDTRDTGKTTKEDSKKLWLSRLRPGLDGDRALLIYKVFYFFYFAAIGSLQPYFGLYLKHSVQLPAYLVGIILGVRPFCLFISAPILGTLADKYRKVKAVLILAVFSLTVSSLIVTVVPPVSLDCLSEVHAKLNISSNHTLPHITGNNSLLKHEIQKHKQQEEKDKLKIKGYGNMDIWGQSWMFDLYQKVDRKTFEKSRVIFAVVLSIVVIGELLGATSNTLADVAVLQNLGNRPTDYGELRLWGAVGWGVTAFITGNIVTHRYSTQTDICPNQVYDIYRPFFYVYASLMTIALFLSSKFEFDEAEKHIGERCSLVKGLEVFMHIEYIIFAAVALFLGIAFGAAEAFLGMHLLNLGATPSLLSALVGIQCLSSMTLYYLSVFLLRKLGHIRVLCVGLLVYIVRFFYYSAISNAWLVLPMEFLSGICTALVWSSLVSYVATPPRIGATLQGILHGLYYGLGRGLGQIAGGMLIQDYGSSKFFSRFALIVMAITVIFLFIAPIIYRKKTIWMSLSGYSQLNEDDDEEKTYRQQTAEFWRGKKD
ncbi:major facilitator superfamily domain-containing protein 6 [Nematostella vectensis]|uniref:major facilitator superfamily domain-containing protein 6 n=1 Tax=Nematostella vectensis TaxID=45351 RepID=UPI002076FA88|nr:major facilitator superfamily domain-containing protein 6 [Nematostella vectensis]